MKRKCFIIMPFSSTKTVKKEDWDRIYEDFFIPAWNEVDFDCERTNIKRGSISKDIIEKCFSAEIVMADLTDTNPNVMYELGLRHTFKKPSIMIRQKDCKIPFDVRDYKIHEYENTSTGLKNFKILIEEVVKDLNIYPERPDNPVWDMIRSGGFIINYYNLKETLNKLNALIEELEYNKQICDTLIKKGEDLTKDLKQGEVGMTLLSLSTDCLSLLITTRYAMFPTKEFAYIIVLHKSFNVLTRGGHILASSLRWNQKPEDLGSISNLIVTIDEVIAIIEQQINDISSNSL